MTAAVLLTLLLSCNSEAGQQYNRGVQTSDSVMVFEPEQWKFRAGPDYPYRKRMLQDLMQWQEFRDMNREQILGLLGEPDRADGQYLFYRITQERFGFWPIHTTTMVILLAEESGVEWIKIHE